MLLLLLWNCMYMYSPLEINGPWKIFDNFLSNINSSYFTSWKHHEICFKADFKCIFSLPLWRKSIFQAVKVAIAFGSLHLVAQNFPFSKTEDVSQVFNFQDCKIFACADVTGHVLLNGGKNKSDLRNPKLPSLLIEALNPFLAPKSLAILNWKLILKI